MSEPASQATGPGGPATQPPALGGADGGVVGFPAILIGEDRLIGAHRLHCPQSDERELVRSFALMRGTYALFVGPTGVGKSVLTYQMALAFSVGRPVLGLTPRRPLRWLIVQNENEEYDVARAREGVFEHMEFTAEERELAGRRVIVSRCDSGLYGLRLLKDYVLPRMKAYQPDMLVLDPVLAFYDGEVNDRGAVGRFVREQLLLGIVKPFNCGGLLIHHTPKPPQTQRSAWRSSEQAYAGMGSVEFANPARLVLTLAATDHSRQFALWATKKWQEVGWKDAQGAATNMKLLTYSGGDLPCWKEFSTDEMLGADSRPADSCLGAAEGSPLSVERCLRCVPVSGWAEWRAVVKMAAGRGPMPDDPTLDAWLQSLLGRGVLEVSGAGPRCAVRRRTGASS